MTPDRERLLQTRCIAFKRIKSLNRLYTVLQFALDLVLLGGMVTQLTVSAHLYPMVIIGVILLKLALVFLLNGVRGVAAGLIVTLTYFPLFAHFEMLDTANLGLIVLILMMHLFRIFPSTANERISGLYGAPGFNGAILADELDKDEKLMSTVLGRYNDVSKDMLVGCAIREVSLPGAVRTMRPVGVLLLTGGICMLMTANSLKADMDSAKTVVIDEKTSGKTISVITDRIYRQNGEGSFDSYWCKVGEQAVNVNVYDNESKEKFLELCNYFEASTEAETAWLSGNSVSEGSDEPVTFIAEVRTYTKYSPPKPSKKTEEYIEDDVEIVHEYYLDVIDPNKSGILSGAGTLLTTIGAVLTGLFYTMFFTSRYNIEML